MTKRSQASMEFLMTYGWAIMGVIIIIGALSYFGVFNTKMFVPKQCEFGNGFYCSGSRLTNTEAIMTVKNSLGAPVFGLSAEVSQMTGSDNAPFACAVDIVDLAEDETCTITCPLPGGIQKAESRKWVMTLLYTKGDGAYTKKAIGNVFAPTSN